MPFVLFRELAITKTARFEADFTNKPSLLLQPKHARAICAKAFANVKYGAQKLRKALISRAIAPLPER